MRHYVAEAGLARALDVPMQVPQVELLRNDALVVATFKIDHSAKLRVRWLNLSIHRIDQADEPKKLNSALGWVYLGVFGPNFDQVCSTPIACISSNQLGSKSSNPWDFIDIESAGTYGIVVVNNLKNVDASVSAAGLARLFYGHA